MSTDGDRLAFVSLVRSLEGPVGAFLAQITADRSLAADLMQESFLVAWRERERLPAGESERRAWMFAIARNRALSALRHRRRGAAAFGRLVPERPGAGAEAHDEALAVRDLLVRTLSPVDRSLFVLRYVHGFDGPELAALTGMKPDAIRKRLQRSAERLLAASDPPTEPEVPDGRLTTVTTVT